ncbi:MarR family transcriptional regulator [Ectothiorhodospiraceae bacterium WFHF3C12]|nr:MarR family transcriptional regulator [Ectothiorhodospiraceae bacterium WFHF3C12]
MTQEQGQTQDQQTGEQETFRVADWPMYFLANIERQHTRNATALLRRYDIDHREWRLLALLHDDGPQTIGYLAEVAALDRSTVSKLVDALVSRGFLARKQSGRDRRQSLVSMTEAGEREYQATVGIVLDLFERYFEGYSQEEFDTLMTLLRDLLRRVQGVSPHGF